MQIVEFNKLLGYEPQPLDVYLKGISRSMLLLTGSHFLGFKAHNLKHLDFVHFLQMFFRPENERFKLMMLEKLKALQSRGNADLLIINTESSLEFFQYAFEQSEQSGTQSDVEIERNVLLAYLALNQKSKEKEKNIIPSIGELPLEEKISAMYFSQSYAYSNLVNYNESELIVGQFIKSVFFFEFMESNPGTVPLLRAFLQYYGIATWKEYIFKLFPFVKGILENEKEGYLDFNVRLGEKYYEDCAFIDKLILNDGDVIQDYDFKKIRSSPLYKIEDGKYRVILSLFVLEKLFRGLYFKLSELNKTLQGTEKVKDLHGLLSDAFSEHVMAYEILNSIYKGHFITFTGKESKAKGLDSEPDYYLRKENKIFLFESKDFLVKADVKTSSDFQKLRKEFEDKLYRDNKGNKAILQLLGNCSRILTSNFSPDTGYDLQQVEIYPILLVHDHQYNVIGLNKIVNSWFNRELQKLNLRKEAIKPITIVNIDSLIYHQDLLRNGVLTLEDLLQGYFRHTTLDHSKQYLTIESKIRDVMKTMIPFSSHLVDIVIEKNIAKVPQMYIDKVRALFPETSQ